MTLNNSNILIYRVGQLGDTLVALPAIYEISNLNPNARLILLSDRHPSSKGFISSWDVLEKTGLFSEVIFYDHLNENYLLKLIKLVKLMLLLKKFVFFRVYNLSMRFDEKSKLRDKIFFKILIGASNYLDLPSIKYPPIHNSNGNIDRLMPEWKRLLMRVNKNADLFAFNLPINIQSKNKIDEMFHSKNLIDQKIIIIGPGSKMNSKKWSEINYINLCKLIINFFENIKIIIIGGADDIDLGNRLCLNFNENVINLCGKLSIYDSVALLKRAILFIGNDSGALHLAGISGTPSVGIFSSRDYPGLWEPYGKSLIIRHSIKCSGCMLETCYAMNNLCLELISVEEVMRAVLKLMFDRNEMVKSIDNFYN